LNAYKRKGFRPAAICDFCERVGITPANNLIDFQLLEHCCRKDLDAHCNRAMAVLDPLKVVITNYGENEVEYLSAPNHPYNQSRGTHQIPFSNTIYIERSDFRLVDDPDFFGLAPNKEVGLRYAYNIICTHFNTNSQGDVTELHVTVDKSKKRKPKGHIHWVAALPGKSPIVAEVRLYDHLFKSLNPAPLENWLDDLNPNSLSVMPNSYLDVSLAETQVGDHFQFERLGFFCKDRESTPNKPVWNRTVHLKDSYHKLPK